MILIPSHVVNLENVILGRISLWPMPWHLKEGKAGSSSDFCKSIHSWAQSFPDVYRNILYIIYPMVLEYIYIYICRCITPMGHLGTCLTETARRWATCLNICYALKRKGENLVFSKSDMGIQTCDIHIQFFSCVWCEAGSLPKPVHQQFMQVNHCANRRKFPQQKQTNDTRVMAAKIQGPILHWSPQN